MIPKSWKAPVEVKVAAALLLGLALAYGAEVLVLMFAPSSSLRSFLLPVTGLILGGVVVTGLALKMPTARYGGFAVVVIFALVHALVLLAAELVWIKLVSGVLFAGYVYAGVLLNSMPLRRYLLGADA
ncbi:hypothetical protein ACFWY9_21090 [Amycolatopsis sp. NPDC059027]|uniref:hypothetical protein n=1 Tax=unclassified Amycolatopsis TaxID=2618356 RepID=UPI003670AB39